jgi:hypothetical protein
MPAKAVPVLSDERWREIRTAAAREPSATARTEIERALAEYFFGKKVIESGKLGAERDRQKQIIDLARQLKTALYGRRRQVPWPEHDPDKPLRELQAVTLISWHHQGILDELYRRDPARALLLWRLLGIWCDHFGGTLTVTDPTRRRRAPSGALVRFVLAATRGLLRPPMNPHTIRTYARRERARRAKGISPPAKT